MSDDPRRDIVSATIAHHYQVKLGKGLCGCGHEVRLGRQFSNHTADAVLFALDQARPVPVPPTVETLAEILSGIAQDFYGPFMPADTVGGSAQRRESIDIARALLAEPRITIRAVEGDTQEADHA